MNRIAAIILGMLSLTACASSDASDVEVDEGALTKGKASEKPPIDEYELVEAAIDSSALPARARTIADQMAAGRKPGFVGTRFKDQDFGVLCEEPESRLCKLVAVVKAPALKKSAGKTTTTITGPLAETLADVFAPTSASAKARTAGAIDCRRAVGRKEDVACEINLERHMTRSTMLVNLVADGALSMGDAEAILKKFQ